MQDPSFKLSLHEGIFLPFGKNSDLNKGIKILERRNNITLAYREKDNNDTDWDISGDHTKERPSYNSSKEINSRFNPRTEMYYSIKLDKDTEGAKQVKWWL